MRSAAIGRGAGRRARSIATGRRAGRRLTRTLAVDIGGSGIKAAVLTETGAMLTDNTA